MDVTVDGAPCTKLRSKKTKWLIAILALHPNRKFSRQVLAEWLWPEQGSSSARAYLRQALTEVRTALGSSAACLETPDPGSVRFDCTEVVTDVSEFDTLVKSDPLRAIER